MFTLVLERIDLPENKQEAVIPMLFCYWLQSVAEVGLGRKMISLVVKTDVCALFVLVGGAASNVVCLIHFRISRSFAHSFSVMTLNRKSGMRYPTLFA